jgi:uncharacterized protein YndB with AHSA1/START domain
MPRAAATRELLAAREDVWQFVAEPRHFADWWPRIAAVEPDRRGLAPGARWVVHATATPTLFRKSGFSGTLVVREVRPYELLAWTLTGDNLEVALELRATAPDRTRVTLEVRAPWLAPLPRSLPRNALGRLYALCQTAARM